MASAMLTTTAIPIQLMIAAHRNKWNWYVECFISLCESLASCRRWLNALLLWQIAVHQVLNWSPHTGTCAVSSRNVCSLTFTQFFICKLFFTIESHITPVTERRIKKFHNKFLTSKSWYTSNPAPNSNVLFVEIFLPDNSKKPWDTPLQDNYGHKLLHSHIY